MNRTLELGTKPISTLLIRFSIPAVIAMLVNAIYNVVDRIFIGNLVGENALAGLTIVFPIMMIIFAFAGLIGAGGAALLSIRLGEKDYDGASRVFGNTLIMAIIVTGVVLATFFVNLDGMLAIFGAKEDYIQYAHDYMEIILMGFIFQMISFVLSSFIRTEGKPTISMTVMIISALTNIVLDAVFIGGLDMGVRGAALGTILGQFVGLCIYVLYYVTGKSSIHLRAEHFKLRLSIILSIISIGFATFITSLGTSVAMTFLNRQLEAYGGTAGVTSMGAINSLFTFFIMPIMGLTQGMQPIVGYNHGAKQKDRVYKTLVTSFFIGSAFSTIVFLILEFFAPTFVSFFLSEGSDTVEVAARGLRIFIAMLPLLSINIMGTAFFQSIAKGRVSIILGMLRQFIFLIPLLYILPNYIGLTGVWIVTPVADALAIIVTSIALWFQYMKDNTLVMESEFSN